MVALATQAKGRNAARKPGARRAHRPAPASRVSIAEPAATSPNHFRFTVEHLQQLDRLGAFPPDTRVELINGEIIKMPPIDPPHADGTDNSRDVVQRKSGSHYKVRCQNPVDLGLTNLPQPDVAVVSKKSYSNNHPTPGDIHLLIEVADSTLAYDLTTKRDLYAKAAIKEYWVLDLSNHQLHVFTKPRKGIYTEQRILAENEGVQCSTIANLKVKVKELLP